MRYKVRQAFTDRLSGKLFKKGSWYSCDDARYEEIKHLLIKEKPKVYEPKKEEPPVEALPSIEEEEEK